MIDKTPGGATIKYSGQFLAENATENIGARITQKDSLNVQSPPKQWTGGDGETFTFDARIFAKNGVQDVASKIAQLKDFSRKDGGSLNLNINRAPIFIFSFGSQISFNCFVRSVGGIKYDELRSDGTLRGASFSIQLEKLEENVVSGTIGLASKIKNIGGIITSIAGLSAGIGLINIPGGSLHTIGRTITAKDGDTFEEIARLEYGDALIGDILRRANVDIANIQPGDEVILVLRDEIFQIEVTPQANALKDEEDQRTLRQCFLELRGGSKTVFL